MSLISKFRSRRKSPPTRKEGAAIESNTDVANNGEAAEVDVNYLVLEPRRVLSADFSLIGAALNLDNFSEINDENVEVDEVTTFYRFQLSEGTWSGTDSASVTGAGTSSLLISKTDVTEIILDDNLGIELDFTFDNVDLSPLDNLTITTDGNIGQLAATSVMSTQLSLTANDIDLSNAGNDFGSVSATSANDFSLTDQNEVVILGADVDPADGRIEVRASGIEIASSISADSVSLNSLQGIEQAISAGIDADELIITGQGSFELNSAANDLNDVAADIDGRLEIFSTTGLNIAELTHGTQITSGLSVTSDLDLQIDGGDLTQSANALIIVGGDASFATIAGDICLNGEDVIGSADSANAIFGSISISASGDVAFAEVDDLVINRLNVAGNSNLSGNNIQFNTNVTVEGLALQATDGVSLNGNSIDVTNLIVTGSGNFDFSADTNSIRNLAAEVTGTLQVGSNVELQIASITIASCGGSTEVRGVNVNGDFVVTLDDVHLNQTAALVVSGVTTLDVGSGDICLSGGDSDGDEANDNDLNQLNVLSANEVEITDINDISIIGLKADNDAAIIAGDSLTDGQIILNGDLAASALLLQANNGVEQISGAIATEQLVLEVDGDVHLCLNNSIGSATTAGQISANIDGELFIGNMNAVELIDLNFTTKSGAIVSQNQFNVVDNLSVISSGENSNAIFDSTQINIGGEAQFITLGDTGDIDLDNLNVAGVIGVATADGDVRLINANASGVVFRGDDISNVDAIETCPRFEANIVNGSLDIQALAGDITNEANAILNVTGSASLIAGTDNASNVSGSNNEFNLELGLEQNDEIQFLDTLSLIGRDASLSINNSVLFGDTFIGNSSATATDGGTLFMAVDGSVTQAAGAIVSADDVAISASDYIVLQAIDSDRVAFSAQGFVDTNSLTSVPTNLPTTNDDPLAPLHTDVDNEYGIIVSSQNDLIIGTLSDALSRQANQTGIFSSQGHAYIETTSGTDIQFDGSLNTNTITANGTTFGVASETQNGHVLTAIAGGDLTIANNTILVTTSGTVTDISPFTTDEGLDFENVTQEGPLFQLFLPTPSDFPTTRTVNTDDSQFIGIDFGRPGEQNFIVEVAYADGTIDVLTFDEGVGNRFQRLSHTFDIDFLLFNFELPTDLSFFNDPAINLFDFEGASEIASVNDLNTNDNFVMAFSDSRPQGDLQIASVVRPTLIPREDVVALTEQQVFIETDSTGFGEESTPVEEQLSDALLVRLDDDGLELDETTEDLPDSTVTQDVVAEWKRRVEDGTQYPPGKYRIRWVESGVTFSIEFEKGVQEDLKPDELRDTKEPFLPPTFDDLPEAEIDNVENDLFNEVRFDEGINFRTPIEDSENLNVDLIAEQELEDEFQIVVEDLADSTSRSRFGLLASGIIAIGLKRKSKSRDGRSPEQEELKATASKISFVKSARSRRRMRR